MKKFPVSWQKLIILPGEQHLSSFLEKALFLGDRDKLYNDFNGSETLIKVDDDTYINVGVALKTGDRMSSWRALLKVVR